MSGSGSGQRHRGIVVALLVAGLAASFFHLGRPERAWRSAAMWRTSWLSREVIALPAFMGLVAVYAFTGNVLAGILGAIACLALFICTGMIYACLPFLQEWRTPLTVVNFILLGSASGLTAAAVLAAWLHPALLRPYEAGALAVGALAYLGRLASLYRNAGLRPKSTLASAIGVKHPKIVQIAQGAMGGSFNTREFFHGRPREVVCAVRLLPGAGVPGAGRPAARRAGSRGVRATVRGAARRALVLLRRGEAPAEPVLPGDRLGLRPPGAAEAGYFAGHPATSPGTLPTRSRKLPNGPMLRIASSIGPSNCSRLNIIARIGPYSPLPISSQRAVSAHIR